MTVINILVLFSCICFNRDKAIVTIKIVKLVGGSEWNVVHMIVILSVQPPLNISCYMCIFIVIYEKHFMSKKGMTLKEEYATNMKNQRRSITPKEYLTS